MAPHDDQFGFGFDFDFDFIVIGSGFGGSGFRASAGRERVQTRSHRDAQVHGAPQIEAKRELQRRLVDFVKRSAEQEGWKPEKDVWVDCPTITTSVQ